MFNNSVKTLRIVVTDIFFVDLLTIWQFSTMDVHLKTEICIHWHLVHVNFTVVCVMCILNVSIQSCVLVSGLYVSTIYIRNIVIVKYGTHHKCKSCIHCCRECHSVCCNPWNHCWSCNNVFAEYSII